MDLTLRRIFDNVLYEADISGQNHNPLSQMIEHQAHSNSFNYQSEYGQSDCGFSHLEMS
jgi:hypothetical protein